MIINSLTKEELVLTVETQKEAAAAINVFTKLNPANPEDILEYQERLLLKNTTYIIPAGRSSLEGNGGWIQNTVVTDYLDPYWNLLNQWTNSQPFKIDLTPALLPIRYTDIQLALIANSQGYGEYTSVFRVYAYQGQWLLDEEGTTVPENKKPGRSSLIEQAKYTALKHINSQLGRTITEPEFIPTAYGQYKKNPKYAKGDDKIAKSLSNEKVWNMIWNTWVEKYANPTQQEVLSKVSRLKESDLKGPSLSSPYIIHTNKWSITLEPKEFANLK